MKKDDRARRSFSCSRWWCVDICAYHICEHATTLPSRRTVFSAARLLSKGSATFQLQNVHFLSWSCLATCGSEQARAEGVTNNLSAEARKYEVQAQ